MKKLTLILTALIILAACTTGGDQQRPTIEQSFIGGNVGLEVGLVEGLPPAAVYDNDRMNFGIGIAIQNVGEANIGDDTGNEYVHVGLEGFSPRRYDLQQGDMDRALFTSRPFLGAQKNFDGSVLPGQIHSEIFEPLSYQDKLQGNVIENIVVKACYDYENYATANICFKDEIFESSQDVCMLTGEKLPQNSGGPIHVTSLVQNPLGPHKVMIGFNLEHVGSGEFYGRESDENCDPAVINTNKYKLDVEVASPDPGMVVDCSTFSTDSSSNTHTGRITMFAGAPTSVVCTLTADDSSGRIFTEPITITSSYRYGERLRQPIVIQAVGDR